MKRLLNLFLLLMAIGNAYAAGPDGGIIVTYQGAQTSYRFDEVPFFKYVGAGDEQIVALYLNSHRAPIVRFPLHGNKLIVTYSEYIPSSIDGVSADKAVIVERNGKKYVQGGRLIIISKDGKKYNLDGTEIK